MGQEQPGLGDPLQLPEALPAEGAEGVSAQVQLLQALQAGQGAVPQRRQRVVGQQEATECGEAVERSGGEGPQRVAGEVEAAQRAQGAPAEDAGQVGAGGRVAEEGAAQVELPQGPARGCQGLGVERCQPVAAQVQEQQAVQAGESLRLQFRDPGEGDGRTGGWGTIISRL